jgi:glutamate transport system permease protein
LAEDALQLILGGFQNTLVIFFFGAIWALVLAMFLTYLHVNHKWQWLYRPLHWFVATIHDVPAVVLMMFFYYVVFSASLNGILVSIIALGVYTSGTLTKIFKIHIKQVGKEQYEAGRMLGFTPKQIYRLIILPQAVKSMLPLVVGEMKVLLRATSYAGYIAQKDLVKAVDSIRTQTEDVFLPLLFISLLYLFLSWLIVKVFHLLHVKLFCYD